jgi:hypothetical protein
MPRKVVEAGVHLAGKASHRTLSANTLTRDGAVTAVLHLPGAIESGGRSSRPCAAYRIRAV